MCSRDAPGSGRVGGALESGEWNSGEDREARNWRRQNDKGTGA